METNISGGEGINILAMEPQTCFHEPRNPLAYPMSDGSQMSATMMMQINSWYPTARPPKMVNYESQFQSATSINQTKHMM